MRIIMCERKDNLARRKQHSLKQHAEKFVEFIDITKKKRKKL